MHMINAIVGRRAPLFALAHALGDAPIYRLRHPEFLVLPLQDAMLELFESRSGQRESVLDGFETLTTSIAALALACSEYGAIAYVATEYFGGDGVQAAASWENGRIVDGPGVAPSERINTALRSIGLIAEPNLDEFDTLGLRDVRSMTDFAKLPKTLI